MSSHLSRRKIADYVAARLLSGDKDVLKELAALLVEAGRVKEQELIIRDIESALASRGVVVADIASARALSSTLRSSLSSYLAGQTNVSAVHLRETIEADLLGGVRISSPLGEHDATLKRRMMTLKAAKQ